MGRQFFVSVISSTLAILSAWGCVQNQDSFPAAPSVPGAAVSYTLAGASDFQDVDAVKRRLATENFHNWSTAHVSCAAIDELRAIRMRSVSTQYKVTDLAGAGPMMQGLFPAPAKLNGRDKPVHDNRDGLKNTNNRDGLKHYSVLGAPQKRDVLSSPITGAPTTAGYGRIYWLTENGDVYCHGIGATGSPSRVFSITGEGGVPLPVGESFKNSNMIIYGYPGSLTGYVCSAQGNLYLINFDPASVSYGETGKVYPVSGADSAVGFTASPFFDNARRVGTTVPVYVVNNKGDLFKFNTNFDSSTIVGTPEVVDLPDWTGSSSYTEYFRTGPIAFNGRVIIGSWLKHQTDSRFDRGRIFYYDMRTAGSPVQMRAPINVNIPFFVSPSVDYDLALNPAWAVAPGHNRLTLIDLLNNASVPVYTTDLVVGNADPNTGSVLDLFPDSSKLATHGIQTPAVIHNNNRRKPFYIYVVNSNALWKINVSSSFDAPGKNPWDHNPQNFIERTDSFLTPETTLYTKTFLGETRGTEDPATGKYIKNNSSVVGYIDPNISWDVSKVYLLDNYGDPEGSQYTSANEFAIHQDDPTAAPTRLQAYDLTGLVSDPTEQQAVRTPGTFMSYGYNPTEFVFNTSSHAPDAPAAALWTWQP